MKRLAAVIVIAIAATSAVSAQGRMPHGKWWQRSEVVQRLQLTRDQQDRLEQVFRQHATQLVDLKADMEKRNIELRNELDETQPQRQKVQTAAGRLNESRGRLFERELMMLLDMRSVLSAEQWSRAKEIVDDKPEGRQQQRRGMQPPRRGRPGQGGPGSAPRPH